jgi:predicted RNA-binding protein associated with RNAse of E/G family
MAYAQGLLTQVSTPVRQYQKDVGLVNDMGLGSIVCCDGENMVIQRVELTEATKMVSVGRQVETYKSAYAAIARRIDAVEKIIL